LLVSDYFGVDGLGQLNSFEGVALDLNYTATINQLIPFLHFSASTATANGYTITPNPAGDFVEAVTASAVDPTCPNQNVAGAGAEDTVSGTFSAYQDFGAQNSVTLLCIPTTTSGEALVSVAEEQGGSAYLGSGGFYLAERSLDAIALGDTGGGIGVSPRLFFPVDEPGSLLLLMAGLGAGAWRKGRRITPPGNPSVSKLENPTFWNKLGAWTNSGSTRISPTFSPKRREAGASARC
jgi:hypothetical protein